MKKAVLILILVFSGISFGFIPNNFLVEGIVTDDAGAPLPGVSIVEKGTSNGTVTDIEGKYSLTITNEKAILTFSYIGYLTQEVKVKKDKSLDIKLSADTEQLEEIVVVGYGVEKNEMTNGSVENIRAADVKRSRAKTIRGMSSMAYEMEADDYGNFNTEEYDLINDNIFQTPKSNPLSTFSIDVDAASYSNLRRMLNNGQTPPKDAIRIEEMINYFDYEYKDPSGEHPFSIATEMSDAPWNPNHKLVHIGLQGKKPDYTMTQPSNLVFLIDASGSMNAQQKLPLLKSSLKLMVNSLKENDRIALVTYAGNAGLVLKSTPVSEKDKIIDAIENLEAGGSTAGAQGIELAYAVAETNLMKEGNNRIILATDGDFNVGVSSTSELVRMIEEKREKGIFLTIAGFGMGNYKDGRMEQISNAGNGNYYYIDNIREAEKVFVKELRATLFTIAKDVKIQVEFNPQKVQAYRLIGYENRKLNAEDFNDDKKDAGELGAGHTVTALYEIIPVGVESEFVKNIDDLKYQNIEKTETNHNNELLTIKFRYKEPNGSKSKLITQTLKDQSKVLNKTSDNFRFSAAVAEFGMLLRDSEFKGNSNYAQVMQLAKGAKGNDTEGYRQEFINMVNSYKLYSKR
ncbi:vWA domain-containing protein [Chondrinema litorale]|uniref:vWA domain-containing protein n=1 Tax=Chondrinema litorale TaxID=2994555 RepID=UPI002542A696|nr:von Willebrand factor type A domain-containing protein [Chondrinema litorale]UZR94502.1 von Willebrand factor type A domain-containing protein [Chondrinema litorale]